MAQMIYSILALSVVTLFSTSLNRTFSRSAQDTYTNEVLSQMIGIGQDILEDVGRRSLPFDEKVDEARYQGPIQYPLVHVAWELTPDSAFGGCVSYNSCLDLDDFHGMTLTRKVDSLSYDVTISVHYVSETDPNQISSTQTFAKLVSVFISSESIIVGGSPLNVEYARVFAYERSTMDTPSSIY